MKPDFPFSAVIGQDGLKLALILATIDPTIGGVLITGVRGSAKSTLARGLAALLPAASAGHPAPFVQLPLGATEDRVVGSLDLSRVLKDGSSELRPGVLSRADGGILYVDEVNLLPDHLVDLLLDAAASGHVTIERDGISARQPARFVLIGTMNPEEGVLRPQFLDRFGLCVQVTGISELDLRKSAIRQRLDFDDDPEGVLAATTDSEARLREGIIDARQRLPTLVIEDAHLNAAASLSIEHRLDGIRGDLAMLKAARALAAWEGATGIGERHVERAAEFVLPHRTRRVPLSPTTRRASPGELPGSSDGERKQTAGRGTEERYASRDGTTQTGAPATETGPPRLTPAPPAPPRAQLRLLTELIDRTTAGRRDARADGSQRGASARSISSGGALLSGSLAITDTLAAAAARGARVIAEGVQLTSADIRERERREPGICHVLFLVDASGSMATQRRLAIAKGAALGLLSSSYQRRDEVALMTFRAEGTELVLPFTRIVADVERALAAVHTGGRTPLARALLDAGAVLRTREPALLVLLTDGRANVGASLGDPWQEALDACAALRNSCAASLVIDCEPGPIFLGRARQLAQALDGQRIVLDEIDDATLTLHIHQKLNVL